MPLILVDGLHLPMRVDGVKNNEGEGACNKNQDQVPGCSLEHSLTPCVCFVTKNFHLFVISGGPAKYDIAIGQMPTGRTGNWYSLRANRRSQRVIPVPDHFASAPGKNS
jgi:hypothetical protein